MQIGSIPIQKEILQQVETEVVTAKRKQQESPKKQLERKYNHFNLIQYHHLREERFMQSQKKAIENQDLSLQKTKQYIKLRQDKAHYNKSQLIVEKSKKTEFDLKKWEKIVEKNKEQQQKKLQQSIHLMKEWEEKLSQSSSQSLRLYKVTKTLLQKSNRNLNKVLSCRKNIEDQPSHKLKNTETGNLENETRYNNSIEAKKQLRLSTQSMNYPSKKNEQDLLEKSLIKLGQKNERINEARYMKHFLLQKKYKIKQEKEANLRRNRQNRLSQIKHQANERHVLLDQKFKNDKIKIRNKKSSLPSISGNKAATILFLNGPGEEWRNKKNTQHKQFGPYQILPANQQLMAEKQKVQLATNDKIVEKMHNVVLLVKKGQKK